MSQPLGTDGLFTPLALDEVLDEVRAAPCRLVPSRRTWAAPPTIWVAAVVLTVPLTLPLTLLVTAGFAIAAQLILTAMTANASLIRRMHHSSSMTHTWTSTVAYRLCALRLRPHGSQKTKQVLFQCNFFRP